jgi:hypothetical protein
MKKQSKIEKSESEIAAELKKLEDDAAREVFVSHRRYAVAAARRGKAKKEADFTKKMHKLLQEGRRLGAG